MKIRHLSFGLNIFLSAVPGALFIHLKILDTQPGASSFWKINLLFFYIIAFASLWLISFICARLIARYFNLTLTQVLQKDSLTYYPLYFILFCFVDLDLYTNGKISVPIILVAVLTMILMLKLAMILELKGGNFKNHAHSLILVLIILPLGVVSYFGVIYKFEHPSINKINRIIAQPKTEQIPVPTPNSIPVDSPLLAKLVKQHPADPLFFFADDIAGAYKKKIRIATRTKNALVLLTPERIETSLKIPPASYLKFDFGVWEDSFKAAGDGVQFNLFFKNKAGVKLAYSKYIDPKHKQGDRKWFDVKLDLGKYAGEELSIAFEVRGSPAAQNEIDNQDDYFAISDPQLVQIKKRRETADYNVVMISIDTLRADHLGCYGYKRKTISPNIDNLAKAGFLFENAISQAPWTTPSHMAMLTSLLPSYHRVNESFAKFAQFLANRGSGYRILDEDIDTLPVIFRRHGYKTLAITSGGTMAGKLGFFKGFDDFKEAPLLDCLPELEAFVKENRYEKYFMFLHTMRVHAPYIDLTYAGEVMKKSQINQLESTFRAIKVASKGDTKLPYETDRLLIRAEVVKLKEMGLFNMKVTPVLYDGGINRTDQYIGELVAMLKENGVLDNTIIALTADHGDEFGDRNPNQFYDYHGRSLYDEMLHVPLLFFIPGKFPAGKRVSDQVRLIDIMPTLLNLTGIEFDDSKIQGVSLLPFINGTGLKDELAAVSEAICCGPEKKSIRTNNQKYIYTVKLRDIVNGERILISDKPDIEELYDFAEDPKEKHNIQAENSELSTTLKNKINQTLKDALKSPTEPRKEKRIRADEQMREKLKALGYL